MTYNESLADRIRQAMKEEKSVFEEKRMMGGLTFMVKGKMCVGIVKNDLMARVGMENYTMALATQGVREMDFTGKPMNGYVFVTPEAIDTDEQLSYWVRLCLDFNKTLA